VGFSRSSAALLRHLCHTFLASHCIERLLQIRPPSSSSGALCVGGEEATAPRRRDGGDLNAFGRVRGRLSRPLNYGSFSVRPSGQRLFFTSFPRKAMEGKTCGGTSSSSSSSSTFAWSFQRAIRGDGRTDGSDVQSVFAPRRIVSPRYTLLLPRGNSFQGSSNRNFLSAPLWKIAGGVIARGVHVRGCNTSTLAARGKNPFVGAIFCRLSLAFLLSPARVPPSPPSRRMRREAPGAKHICHRSARPEGG